MSGPVEPAGPVPMPDWIEGLPEVAADFPGGTGRIIDHVVAQAVLWTFADGGTVPEHAHAAQVGFVLDGAVSLTVDGRTITYGRGTTFDIPEGQLHTAEVRPGTRVIEVYEDPDRHRPRQPPATQTGPIVKDRALDDYLDLEPLETRIDTHRRFSERPDDVEAALLGCITPDAGDVLLDVGSGTGEFLRNLRIAGHTGRLVALDSSPAAVSSVDDASVEAHLGDACDLLFEDGSFDVVTARHMLYHVRDLPLAVREARRVLRPGGTFAAVVNNSDSSRRLKEAVAAAATACGIEVPPDVGTRANSANVPDVVAAVFGQASVTRFDNALVFDGPDPLLRHLASVLAFFGVHGDHDRRAVMEVLAATVDDCFASGQGPWRDEKGYIVCTARRADG